MIRAWLSRRRPAPQVDPTVLIGSHVDYLTGQVEGLRRKVAELQRDVANRDRRIAELQRALAPYAAQDLVRRGLHAYMAQGRARDRRLAEEPTTEVTPPAVWRTQPTEQWRRA